MRTSTWRKGHICSEADEVCGICTETSRQRHWARCVVYNKGTCNQRRVATKSACARCAKGCSFGKFGSWDSVANCSGEVKQQVIEAGNLVEARDLKALPFTPQELSSDATAHIYLKTYGKLQSNKLSLTVGSNQHIT